MWQGSLIRLWYSNKVFNPAFTCSNSTTTKKNTHTLETCQIYSKLTIKTPKRRLLLLLVTLNMFRSLFYCYYCWIRTNNWVWEDRVSDNKSVFSNYEKYVALWAGKVCWATHFHLYSPKTRLRKDDFSRQPFRKISRTLNHLTYWVLWLSELGNCIVYNSFVAKTLIFSLEFVFLSKSRAQDHQSEILREFFATSYKCCTFQHTRKIFFFHMSFRTFPRQ